MKIENDKDHRVAMAWLEQMMEGKQAWANVAGQRKLDDMMKLVATAIEAYEKERWPIPEPSADALAEYEKDVGRPFEGSVPTGVTEADVEQARRKLRKEGE